MKFRGLDKIVSMLCSSTNLTILKSSDYKRLEITSLRKLILNTTHIAYHSSNKFGSKTKPLYHHISNIF